jgi:hypothetical protein
MIGRVGSRGHHVAPQREAPVPGRLESGCANPELQNALAIPDENRRTAETARRRKAAISLLRLAKS